MHHINDVMFKDTKLIANLKQKNVLFLLGFMNIIRRVFI
ncbi:hypothetical protein EZS27_005379 [termite gut metagenome]|uniref:Uncharacterized protein n=1 Tax=termite gut metagenome TaxID=433724 RepID=A0A5J4SN29_9ZZZZ